MSRGIGEVVADAGFKAMSAAHRTMFWLSGGRLLGRPFGMWAVELHTVGRTSGRDRATMLTAPVVDGERIVLVASKGGDRRHPDWYRNLVACPDVEVVMGGSRRAMRARTATPEEKAALWPRVTAAYPGYASYQRRTDREIPLVICDPR